MGGWVLKMKLMLSQLSTKLELKLKLKLSLAIVIKNILAQNLPSLKFKRTFEIEFPKSAHDMSPLHIRFYFQLQIRPLVPI